MDKLQREHSKLKVFASLFKEITSSLGKQTLLYKNNLLWEERQICSGQCELSVELNYNYIETSVDNQAFLKLTLSVLQTQMATFANIVDSDETACNESSHHDPQFAILLLFIWLKPLFATMDVFKFGRVHFRNSGVKRLIVLKLLQPSSRLNAR